MASTKDSGQRWMGGKLTSEEKIDMKVDSRPGPMLAPVPSVMVSCGTMESSNIITIAWTGIINSDPPMTYISVQRSRFSHDIIEESGEFVINLVTAGLTKAMDMCGVRSGRDIDKFDAAGLTREAASEVAAPMIAESPVSIECRVTEVMNFPTHDMFIAEIVAVHIDEDYVDDKGAYDFGSMDLVAYNHGKYYRLMPEEIGFFGYSVMKPETAKRRAAAKSKSGAKTDPAKRRAAAKAKSGAKTDAAKRRAAAKTKSSAKTDPEKRRAAAKAKPKAKKD